MLASLTLGFVLLPWQAALRPLGDDARAAMRAVTEGRVRTAVSFLASDELEGRDTGSRGLEVASVYAAARFRGAGLKGLGKDGSYFLYAVDYRVPRDGVVLETAGGEAAQQLGLLAAPETHFEYTGRVPFVGTGLPRDARAKWPDDVRGPVAVAEATVSRRGVPARLAPVLAVVEQARRASRKGATALLVRVATDSPLVQTASELPDGAGGSAAMMLRRAPVPILLVPQDAAIDGVLRIVVPPLVEGPSDNRNVAAVLEGRDPEKKAEALLITAHLDHIGIRGRGNDTIHNGADDNTTGSTAVLSLADAFAALATPPKRSVIFVLFWGEERGLLGSKAFAAEPPWPLDRIVANVNIEMIGRPEDGARYKMWMTGWTESDLGELIARGSRRAGIETFRHRRFSPMLYRASDNWAFVEKGVIAHSFSAGSLHRDYHRPGDEWEKLDIPHMTKIIHGLFAGCLPIAEATLTPAKT